MMSIKKNVELRNRSERYFVRKNTCACISVPYDGGYTDSAYMYRPLIFIVNIFYSLIRAILIVTAYIYIYIYSRLLVFCSHFSFSISYMAVGKGGYVRMTYCHTLDRTFPSDGFLLRFASVFMTCHGRLYIVHVAALSAFLLSVTKINLFNNYRNNFINKVLTLKFTDMNTS